MTGIDALKEQMAEMFAMSIDDLGDPFDGNRKEPLPTPVKYLCQKHGWWYPQDNVCCPGCFSGIKEES